MQRKKVFAGILAVTALTAGIVSAAPNPFKDLPKGHWAYDAVNML